MQLLIDHVARHLSWLHYRDYALLNSDYFSFTLTQALALFGKRNELYLPSVVFTAQWLVELSKYMKKKIIHWFSS